MKFIEYVTDDKIRRGEKQLNNISKESLAPKLKNVWLLHVYKWVLEKYVCLLKLSMWNVINRVTDLLLNSLRCQEIA